MQVVCQFSFPVFQVTLPNGVRYIFALDGRVVEAVNELLHGENYVCSSTAVFKKLDYLKMTQEQEQIQQSWKGMKRDTYYLGKHMIGLLYSTIVQLTN